MKKIAILSLVLLMLVCLCACSIPHKKPTEGVWHCPELKISIDFGIYHSEETNQCAEYHNDDGSTTGILARFDYGNGVNLVSVDQGTDYLIGKFAYRNDVFVITRNSDKEKFVFEKVADRSAPIDNGEMPSEGIWYCADLKISVDFGLYVPECALQAKYHNDDGSTTAILYYYEDGGETEFFTPNNDKTFVLGRFYFNDGVKIVAYEDKKEYTFVRIDDCTGGGSPVS